MGETRTAAGGGAEGEAGDRRAAGREAAVGTADLLALVAAGELPANRLAAALGLTGLAPVDGADWRRAWLRLLPAVAILLAIAAAICIVAANWQALGRFTKFGAGLALLIAVVVAALAVGLDPRSGPESIRSQGRCRGRGRWLLLLAIGLIGPLLALYGQTYQTGADIHRLMSTWALLALPWMIAARLAAAWMLVLAIVEGACLFWLTAVNGWWWLPRPLSLPTWFAAALLQAAVLAFWELAARRLAWLDSRWPQRTIAFAWLAILTVAVSMAIVHDEVPWREATFVAWAATIAGLGWCYGRHQGWHHDRHHGRHHGRLAPDRSAHRPASGPDVPILALMLLSLTAVVAVLVGDATHSTFATALAILVVIAVGAWGLRTRQLTAGDATRGAT